MATKGGKADHSSDKVRVAATIDPTVKARQDEMSRIRIEREKKQKEIEQAHEQEIATARWRTQQTIAKIDARLATKEVARKISERIAVRQWMDEKYGQMEAERVPVG